MIIQTFEDSAGSKPTKKRTRRPLPATLWSLQRITLIFIHTHRRYSKEGRISTYGDFSTRIQDSWYVQNGELFWFFPFIYWILTPGKFLDRICRWWDFKSLEESAFCFVERTEHHSRNTKCPAGHKKKFWIPEKFQQYTDEVHSYVLY